jgi:hypothetical protein
MAAAARKKLIISDKIKQTVAEECGRQKELYDRTKSVTIYIAIFFSLFAKKSYEKLRKFAKTFAKMFVFSSFFAKIFHLECGSGFRSHLNVYPDPKHWLKIFAKTETLRKNHPGNKNSSRKRKCSRKRKFLQNEILQKVSKFSLIFAFRANSKRGFRFNESPAQHVHGVCARRLHHGTQVRSCINVSLLSPRFLP